MYEVLNLNAGDWFIDANTGTYSGGIIDFLLEKEFIYEVAGVEGYVINTEKLMGKKQAYGNGTDGKTDVYKLEEVKETASISKVASTQVIKVAQTGNEAKVYKVVYYGFNSSEVVQLGSLTGGNYAELPSAEGTKPYLPSSDFTLDSSTSLKTGLVIKDKDGNEYVWIEVPNDGTGPDYSGVEDSTDYENIETALHEYASDYRESGYVDEWYDGMGSAKNEEQSESGTIYEASKNLDDTTGCGLTYSQYVALKNKMLASIYDNGGFWIGRYEAGIPEPRLYRTEVSTDTTIKALSQQNQYPLNFILCNEAQILASKVNSGNRSSSLMFGIQWDLVLKHIEVKAVENGTPLATIQSELKTDSTSWGNHYRSEYTISNTKSKYYTKSSNGGWSWTNGAYGFKKSLSAVSLSTGADVSFSKMNIFDLAGNLTEYTLESESISSSRTITRGGDFRRNLLWDDKACPGCSA